MIRAGDQQLTKRFSPFDIIDAPYCDLCLFGDGFVSINNLRAIKRALPFCAHVIVIDTRLPATRQITKGQTRFAAWKIRQKMDQMRLRLWQWQTGIEIQTRYGCRLISCEESFSSKGEVRLVIDYRSQIDPDRPRPLLAKRLIWTSGFGQMMGSF
tara:strand:+ start:2342 stop:2806 length:465 start_codon:yes stop_codon:yes gene_type:complete